MEDINTQKSNKYLIIAIISMTLAVIGVAVAAYTFNFKSEANTITTGNISIRMLESADSINITNALPTTDVDGKNLTHSDGSSGVFDFDIITYASGAPGNIAYNISITKDTVDTGYTALADNQVKVYLVKYTGAGNLANETQVVAPTLVSNIITSGNTGNIKTNIVNSHNTVNQTITTHYRIKMWIDQNVNASSWNQNTKLQYKLKVNANGQASI